MGFVAVAVLGLTANLLLQGGNTAVRTRVERIAPDASLLAPAAIAAVPLRTRTDTDPVPQDVKPVAAEPTETPVKRRPARVTRAAPSPEALVATLAEFDRRILAALPGAESATDSQAGRTPLETIPATDDEVRNALDAATARFTRDAAAVGAPAETLRQLHNQLRSHQSAGLALQASAVRRSAQMEEYRRSLDALETQLRQPLDRSLKLFGRTFARESVIAINQGFDAIRQAALDIGVAPPLPPAAADRLAAAEAVFGRLLVEHDASLARSQGPQWTAGVRARFDALAAARDALLQTDAAHAATLAHFSGDAPAITDSIRALARRLAKQQADAALSAARAAALAEAQAGRAVEADAVAAAAAAAAAELAASADAARLPQPATAPLVRTVTEKITTESVSSVSLLWVTGGVLGLLLLTTIVTVRGVTGPVRRLTEATRRLARGDRDVRVPNGGARELDALGTAFNEMARQLDAARLALEGHQQRLEAQVAERTRDLQHLAENDPLTLLPNRRHLFTRLTTAIGRAQANRGGVAVMFLDVDNFKIINDSLSHEFGDQVLQQVSDRLRAVVGPAGFCARLGGDEFTVVHEGAMSLAALGDLAARLVVAFEPPLRVRDQELKVTISVGVSKYPEHAEDAEGLLRAADTALFRSKERGRNQFALFNQEMLEEAARKFTIEQGLHGAIERDELRLVFQPEVSLDGNHAVAVEALLRWQRADGRLVPPGEFLADRRTVAPDPGHRRLGDAHGHRQGGRMASRAMARRARRGQRLAPPAAGRPLRGPGRGPAARTRAARRLPRDRAHRVGAADRPGDRAVAARAARPRGLDRAGRLRHRLFLARLAGTVAAQPREARSQPDLDDRLERALAVDRPCDHRTVPRPRPRDHRRGRRAPDPVRAAGTRARRDAAGLPVRQADHRGGMAAAVAAGAGPAGVAAAVDAADGAAAGRAAPRRDHRAAACRPRPPESAGRGGRPRAFSPPASSEGREQSRLESSRPPAAPPGPAIRSMHRASSWRHFRARRRSARGREPGARGTQK